MCHGSHSSANRHRFRIDRCRHVIRPKHNGVGRTGTRYRQKPQNSGPPRNSRVIRPAAQYAPPTLRLRKSSARAASSVAEPVSTGRKARAFAPGNGGIRKNGRAPRPLQRSEATAAVGVPCGDTLFHKRANHGAIVHIHPRSSLSISIAQGRPVKRSTRSSMGRIARFSLRLSYRSGLCLPRNGPSCRVVRASNLVRMAPSASVRREDNLRWRS